MPNRPGPRPHLRRGRLQSPGRLPASRPGNAAQPRHRAHPPGRVHKHRRHHPRRRIPNTPAPGHPRPQRSLMTSTNDFVRRPALEALVQIPGGVFSRPAFMITKESRSRAIKSLRQEQSLRDHDTAVEAGYASNPKFPDLIPRPIGLGDAAGCHGHPPWRGPVARPWPWQAVIPRAGPPRGPAWRP